MNKKQTPTTPTEIKIQLPTNAYFMSGIRDFTLALIRNMTDFSETWAYRFQSVVDELCNNAIEHGSDKDDKILITFNTSPDQSIQITVEDNGTNPNAKTAEQIKKIMQENSKKSISELGIRGRGLAYIVDKWTDKLEIEDRPGGGLKVSITKFLHDPNFQTEINNDPTHIILNN
jgi:anti-sigma regulatory factor (Ser/Thr protein kinase)